MRRCRQRAGVKGSKRGKETGAVGGWGGKGLLRCQTAEACFASGGGRGASRLVAAISVLGGQLARPIGTANSDTRLPEVWPDPTRSTRQTLALGLPVGVF